MAMTYVKVWVLRVQVKKHVLEVMSYKNYENLKNDPNVLDYKLASDAY